MSASFDSMFDGHWRLLIDALSPGDWNMAVDEVLLDGVQAGRPPTLRFYGWSPACLSLGYFQRIEIVDFGGCRAQQVDVVRRPTGGRAILHDRELTYSITLPANVLGQDAGILPSYYRISRALQAGLTSLGVATTMAPDSAAPASAEPGPICFDRPSAHEILLNGRKLVGSAQVRRGNALLQHGSIVIEPQIDRLLACLSGDAPDSVAIAGLRSRVIGLAEVGLRERDQLAHAFAVAFEREFEVGLVVGGLTQSEIAAASRLAASKYRSPAWTEGRLRENAVNTTRTR